MNKKIIKINNLRKAESFIQLNYTKGFKYIDKAGEFMNNLYKDDEFPPYAMNPEGLIAKLDEKTNLKVSSHNLWMHFIEPTDFKSQQQNFLEKAKLVNSLFEPEQYTRIGWRSYLVFICDNNYPELILQDNLNGGELTEFKFTKKIGSIEGQINVSKLINNDTGYKAILFDIDFFKKEKIQKDDFSKIIENLNKINKAYNSDELLEIINNLLK